MSRMGPLGFWATIVLTSFLGIWPRSSMAVQEDQRALPPISPKDLAGLEQALQKILDESETAGAGVALVSRDEVLWLGGLGRADIATGRRVTPDTLFRIGSISKSFVGLAVLMLQEQGKLDLNDKLSVLAPEIEFDNPWEETDPVRLAHLLEHTTGFDDIHLREYAHNDPHPISLREGLAYEPKSRSSRWKPGTYLSYCNSGPAVAAYIVEKVTGKRFEDFVQENLFDPIGMATASYFLTEAVEENLAKGYEGDGVTEAPYWHILVRPSGAINASAREMAYFVQMLLNRGAVDGRPILQPQSIERMETPATAWSARRGLPAGYALGNYTDLGNGFVFHGHSGGVNAYLADYGYLREQGVGYAFMISSGDGDVFEKIQELLRRYITRELEKPIPATADVAPEELERWVGYYEPVAPRTELTRFLVRLTGITRVTTQDGRLAMKSVFGDKQVYRPSGKGQFAKEGDPIASIMFLDAESGEKIVLGRFGGYRAIPFWFAWLELGLAGLSLVLMASSILFALVWVPRKLLGRLRGISHLSVRTVPLLSVLSLAGAFGLIFAAGEDVIWDFGRPTIWSWSWVVLTWLFAIFAVSGLVQAFRNGSVRKSVRVHSLLVSLANLTVMLYLSYWGIIGLRPWV